jgi:hypothetical protein
LAPTIGFFKNHVAKKTDVKVPALRAAKTTLYAKSELTFNTGALTIRIKTPNEVYKKNVDVKSINSTQLGRPPRRS